VPDWSDIADKTIDAVVGAGDKIFDTIVQDAKQTAHTMKGMAWWMADLAVGDPIRETPTLLGSLETIIATPPTIARGGHISEALEQGEEREQKARRNLEGSMFGRVERYLGEKGDVFRREQEITPAEELIGSILIPGPGGKGKVVRGVPGEKAASETTKEAMRSGAPGTYRGYKGMRPRMGRDIKELRKGKYEGTYIAQYPETASGYAGYGQQTVHRMEYHSNKPLVTVNNPDGARELVDIMLEMDPELKPGAQFLGFDEWTNGILSGGRTPADRAQRLYSSFMDSEIWEIPTGVAKKLKERGYDAVISNSESHGDILIALDKGRVRTGKKVPEFWKTQRALETEKGKQYPSSWREYEHLKKEGTTELHRPHADAWTQEEEFIREPYFREGPVRDAWDEAKRLDEEALKLQDSVVDKRWKIEQGWFQEYSSERQNFRKLADMNEHEMAHAPLETWESLLPTMNQDPKFRQQVLDLRNTMQEQHKAVRLYDDARGKVDTLFAEQTGRKPQKYSGYGEFPRGTQNPWEVYGQEQNRVFIFDEIWEMAEPSTGSNWGGRFVNDTGQDAFIKFPNNPSQAGAESLGDKLAGLMDLPNKESNYDLTSSGMWAAWSEVQDITELGTKKLRSEIPKHERIRNLIHASWTGNWDVVGLGGDNLVRFNMGTPEATQFHVGSIDYGGSFLWRAQGAEKPGGFPAEFPSELITLRDPNINPDSAHVFGDITDLDLAKDIIMVGGKLSNKAITDAMQFIPFRPKDKKAILEGLLERRNRMLDWAEQVLEREG
jgi:hypothetical protein